MVTLTPVGNMYEEGNYYVQKVDVSSQVDMASYEITATANLPEGTIITKGNGTQTNSYNGKESLFIKVPKAQMNKDISNAIINIQGKCKTYPVFYGKTTVAGTQNYALAFDPFGDGNGRTILNIKNNSGRIEVNKTDDETHKAIAGVEFALKNADGTIVGNAKTNNDGVAIFENLYQGDYKLVEIATNNDYILNTAEKDVYVEYNKTAKVDVTNTHKKGNVKVYKIDKDNHRVVLGNVEFQLYSNEFQKVIGTYYTDANGELEIKNLRTGDYSLIETKTSKWYNLADNKDIKVEWNLTKEIQVENELKKGQVKVIKVDKDNNEVKLKGVKFDVLDKNGKVLETIVTNENGEATTSKYAIRDFENLRLKEKETLEEYSLDEEIKTIKLEENQITNIKFENEKIKGQIKIVKTSEDDNIINGKKAGEPIPNVKFAIYDKDHKLVQEVVTDEKGIAMSDILLKGKYFIKEVSAGEWYLLNDKEFTTEIKVHKEVVEVDVTNKSEKPSIDVEKEGIIQTTANQEIKYDFKLKNTGNTPLNNFTWTDELPTDYVRITKLITGTFNQDLRYSIYYKTNKNDYKLLKENLSTKVNNYIDFAELELAEDEYVTEFKADFGNVEVGFESVINPYIFVRVNSDVKNDDTFTNKTKVEGYNKTYKVWDNDNHTTKVYEKQINVKKLPRTGM